MDSEEVTEGEADTHSTVRLERGWLRRLKDVASRRHRSLAGQIRAMVEVEEVALRGEGKL